MDLLQFCETICKKYLYEKQQTADFYETDVKSIIAGTAREK